MKKKLYIIALLALVFIIPQDLSAQRWKLRRYEAYFGVGSASLFGDIGGKPSEENLLGLADIPASITNTRLSFTAGVRYKFYQNISGKFNVLYGWAKADDATATLEQQQARGFVVSTQLIETSILGEYYFIPEQKKLRHTSVLLGNRGRVSNFNTFSAYVYGGVGGVFFFPKHVGNSVSVREPEEVSGYSKVSLALPIGVGLKYSIDNQWSLGLEIGGRYCFSDYLDGFSSNAEANTSKDIYYFSSLTGIYKIKNDRNNVPQIFKKQYGSEVKRRKPKKYKKPKPPKSNRRFSINFRRR